MNNYGFDFTDHLENMVKTIEQNNRKISRFNKALKEVEIHFKKESNKVYTEEEIKEFAADKKLYFISCPFCRGNGETYSKSGYGSDNLQTVPCRKCDQLGNVLISQKDFILIINPGKSFDLSKVEILYSTDIESKIIDRSYYGIISDIRNKISFLEQESIKNELNIKMIESGFEISVEYSKGKIVSITSKSVKIKEII